jgi:phosphohistidine phosphatase
LKTLTLLRHAKSGWNDPVARDFDRPLNPKGHRAAHLMGQHMRDLGMIFDHVVASPATRVVETLNEVAKGYGRAIEPEWDRRIYLASGVTLLDIVTALPDCADHVLLVGHNPGLEDLALMLVADRDDNPLRDALEAKYPTATLAGLTFAIDRWADAAADGASLDRFIRPRDLDTALGPEEDY